MEIKSEKEVTNSSYLYKIIFILFVLISIHFWTLKWIFQPYNAENMLVWIVCAFACVMVFRQPNLRFKYPILIFVLGLLVNCCASYINRGQSLKDSILSFSFYYFILLYYLMHYLKLERKFVENIILVFGILYALIFTIQYKVFPYELFSQWVKTAIDELQFEIVGHGFLMLAFFLAINRYMHNHKIIYILLSIFFLMVQFKCGFRTLIAGAIVVAALLIIRLVRLNIRDIVLMFFACILIAALTQYKSVSRMIDNMIKKTQNESKKGDDYVRNVELEFYYKNYPQNFSYYIIGGGKPAGKSIRDFNSYILGMNYNIVWVDIGLLGFYIVVGAIATLGIVLYSLRAIFTKMPRDALYPGAYFFYLILVSFTNEEIFRDGIFSVQAIALYLVDATLNEKAKTEKERSGGNSVPVKG